MSVIIKLFVIVVLTLNTPAFSFGTDEPGNGESIEKKSDGFSSSTLKVQVLLDRAMFSPGAIDGRTGTNFETSIKAFQLSRSHTPTGKLDDKTSRALLALPTFTEEMTTDYRIRPEDVNRDFITSLPAKLTEQAKLESLEYGDIKELLSERFHATPELLEHLNPDSDWKENSVIVVPNVYPTWFMTNEERKKAARTNDKEKNEENDREEEIQLDDQPLSSGLVRKTTGTITVVVTKTDTSLTVLDEDRRIVFHAPASAGSKHDPLPLGDWKINGTEHNPMFNYNPELFWDADASDKKAKIPAGPNNPVGVAWIDLSKRHYGIHGSPNPEKIGYTQSHGCVRLTNWDVVRLADMVRPGTKVLFLETPEEMEEELGIGRVDEIDLKSGTNRSDN